MASGQTIRPKSVVPRRDTATRTLQAYERHVAAFVRKWARPSRRPPFLLECLGLLSKESILLDLGSGAGQDTLHLLRHGYRVVGVDLTWPFLHAARLRSRRLSLVQGDMRYLPLRDRTFDGVWAAASLIHLSKAHVRKTLRELEGLVKPQGILAATFAHGRRSGFIRSGWIPGRFISRWYREELQQAVRDAGWDVMDLKTVANREREGRWLNLLARRRPKELCEGISF